MARNARTIDPTDWEFRMSDARRNEVRSKRANSEITCGRIRRLKENEVEADEKVEKLQNLWQSSSDK